MAPTRCRMSTISVPLSHDDARLRACFTAPPGMWRRWFMRGSALVAALDGFGDPRDSTQPAVPGGTDRRQLRDGAGELGLVHLVAAFASGLRGVDQSDPVEHAEVLGDRLARDRQ